MIAVVYNDGSEANLIHMDKKELIRHWIMWLNRLKQYEKLVKDQKLLHK